MSVLALLVCIAATTIAFISRLDSFLLNDEGAISLITEEITEEIPQEENNIKEDELIQSAKMNDIVQSSKIPGFEANDENDVWHTNTQIEIFRVSYENGEQIVTVNSENGDKVIAPGTENSYIFKLKNTGDVALDYVTMVEAYVTPADVKIPIQGRLSRYDGLWLAGDQKTYKDIADIDGVYDEATLGAGKYTYYIFDWIWPFENGNDELDTLLGNLATEQDITLKLVINNFATESDDISSNNGITTPKTGDDMDFMLWFGIAGSLLFIMLVVDLRKQYVKVEED